MVCFFVSHLVHAPHLPVNFASVICWCLFPGCCRKPSHASGGRSLPQGPPRTCWLCPQQAPSILRPYIWFVCFCCPFFFFLSHFVSPFVHCNFCFLFKLQATDRIFVKQYNFFFNWNSELFFLFSRSYVLCCLCIDMICFSPTCILKINILLYSSRYSLTLCF